MSETRPKRAVRESAQSEAALADATKAVTAPVVEQTIMPAPESVSAIAIVQAAPIGPACTIPSAPGSASSDKASEAPAENAWVAFAEAQSALARGFEKAAVEMTGISRLGIAATADAAVALLGARSFAEAVEINAGLARRGVDAMLDASARLSEIGACAVVDAARPILSQLGEGWSAFSVS